MLFSLEQFLQKIQLNLQTTFDYYNKFKKKRKLGQFSTFTKEYLLDVVPFLLLPLLSRPTLITHTSVQS